MACLFPGPRGQTACVPHVCTRPQAPPRAHPSGAAHPASPPPQKHPPPHQRLRPARAERVQGHLHCGPGASERLTAGTGGRAPPGGLPPGGLPGQGTQGPWRGCRWLQALTRGWGEPWGLNAAPLTGPALQAGSGQGERALALPRAQGEGREHSPGARPRPADVGQGQRLGAGRPLWAAAEWAPEPQAQGRVSPTEGDLYVVTRPKRGRVTSA